MTEKDWEVVRARIDVTPPAHLIIDGYDIKISLQRVKMKLYYLIIVNDTIKEEWMDEECEIRRKFYQCHKKHLFSTAEKKKADRALRKYMEENDKVYEHFGPWWGSFSRMKSHLIKNNQSIELVRE